MSKEIIPIERIAQSIRWIRGHKVSELEQRVGKHDEEIDAILEAIRQLMAPPDRPRREIGFHVREKAPRYRARKRA
jgi:hypothetical protein